MSYLEKLPFTAEEQEKINTEELKERVKNRPEDQDKPMASVKVAMYKQLNQKLLLVNFINDDPLKTAQAIFEAQNYTPVHNELTEAVENKNEEKVIKYFQDWADSVSRELNNLEEKANELSKEELAYKECLKTKFGRLNDYIQILKLRGEIKGL